MYKNILYFSPISWDFLWTRFQQLAVLLSEKYRIILYVGQLSLKKVIPFSRLFKLNSNLIIYDQHFLPLWGEFCFLRKIITKWSYIEIQKILKKQKFHPHILWWYFFKGVNNFI